MNFTIFDLLNTTQPKLSNSERKSLALDHYYNLRTLLVIPGDEGKDLKENLRKALSSDERGKEESKLQVKIDEELVDLYLYNNSSNNDDRKSRRRISRRAG